VRPNHARQLVYLQRQLGGVWRTVAAARLSATSAYAFRIRPGVRATLVLRVYKPADTANQSGLSGCCGSPPSERRHQLRGPRPTWPGSVRARGSALPRVTRLL
jgi:hypothetical protein